MLKRYVRLFLVATISSLSGELFAQDDETLLKNFLADCRSGTSVNIPKEVRENAKRSKRLLTSFEIALMKPDKTEVCAINGIVEIGSSNTAKQNIGRICVDLLVKKLQGASLHDYILARIDDWPEAFFSEDHKRILYELAKKPATPHRSKFISLLARLRYKPAIGLIRTELANEKTPSSTKFYYHIFLAKLAEQPSIDWLTSFLTRKKINDESIEIVPIILSTKQKPLVQWVVNGLYDVEDRCYTSDPDAEKKINCGYRILEYLALVIKNFPLKTDATGLVTQNYEQVLIESKDWFTKNPDYTIK